MNISFSKCLRASVSVPAPCGSQVLVPKGCMHGVCSFFQAQEINHVTLVNSNLTTKCNFGIKSWHVLARNVCAPASRSKGSIDGGKDRLYHPELSSTERKAKRSQAHRMGKSLVICNMGAKGITLAWLESLFATIRANQLVKVRLGGNDKETTAEELCALLDCVCVQSIGSVIVLYRQKGLPEPMKLQRMREKNSSAQVSENSEENKSDKVNGMRENQIENRKRSHNPDGPPEFTIIK